METWNLYLIIIFGLGVLFFVSVVAAFVWAQRTGQFRNLDRGAMSVFSEDEPAGSQIDFFPGRKKQKPANPTGGTT